jgi:hypothetical protein
VADFLFVMPNGQAAFLELKAIGGTLSDAQIEFRGRVLACKCGYATARSIEEVETILSGWLALFGRKLLASIVQRAA